MYIWNYKKYLNIAESTSLQNGFFSGIYFGVFGRTTKICENNPPYGILSNVL